MTLGTLGKMKTIEIDDVKLDINQFSLCCSNRAPNPLETIPDGQGRRVIFKSAELASKFGEGSELVPFEKEHESAIWNLYPRAMNKYITYK